MLNSSLIFSFHSLSVLWLRLFLQVLNFGCSDVFSWSDFISFCFLLCFLPCIFVFFLIFLLFPYFYSLLPYPSTSVHLFCLLLFVFFSRLSLVHPFKVPLVCFFNGISSSLSLFFFQPYSRRLTVLSYLFCSSAVCLICFCSSYSLFVRSFLSYNLLVLISFASLFFVSHYYIVAFFASLEAYLVFKWSRCSARFPKVAFCFF